jgi:hypothetical protein
MIDFRVSSQDRDNGQSVSARAMTPTEGLLFALGSAMAYVVMLWLNTHVIHAQEAFTGATVFFLPAGVKLLALMIGRQWGALGLLCANFAMSFQDWPGTSPYVLLTMALLWVGLPLLMVLLLGRLLRLRSDLRGITFSQFVLIDATTAGSNSLAYNGYLVWLGLRDPGDYWGAVSAMALGDFMGSGAMVLLVLLALWALGAVQSRLGSR